MVEELVVGMDGGQTLPGSREAALLERRDLKSRVEEEEAEWSQW